MNPGSYHPAPIVNSSLLSKTETGYPGVITGMIYSRQVISRILGPTSKNMFSIKMNIFQK